MKFKEQSTKNIRQFVSENGRWDLTVDESMPLNPVTMGLILGRQPRDIFCFGCGKDEMEAARKSLEKIRENIRVYQEAEQELSAMIAEVENKKNKTGEKS